jgi:hypothetical protein
MSYSAFPTFRRISQTPLRDLLRCRISGRLDWKSAVAAAGLPKPATELIRRVVKRTRLWRLEKAAVANELAAHFSDGLAAGSNAGQLIETFGDEQVAARLIRRAKRRGRPWPWHVWQFSVRVMALVLAIYAVVLIRFCVGQPTVSVDYIARLNAPIAAILQSDRAWPLWRQAILACADRAQDGSVVFPEAIMGKGQEKPAWPETVKWLDQHAVDIEVARQAGGKPAMGLVLGPGGPADDPVLGLHVASPGYRESLFGILLPHLRCLRVMALVLSLDAKLAAERGEPARVEADLMSMAGLSRQLRNADGLLVTQLVALGVRNQALSRLRSILLDQSGVIMDGQLIRLAHAFSGPRVAADLIDLKAERESFADIVQRSYTDDGHGDGHMTLTGLRYMARFMEGAIPAHVEAASTVSVFAISRAEVVRQYARLMDQNESNFRRPIRQADINEVGSQINAMRDFPIELIRFGVAADFLPALSAAQMSCERYLGERDGLLVGIALELYRRQHGHYPASLSELTPGLLPAIPADRVTGDPVKYKLIDGKPVVYSVGADRIDDGGRPPSVVEPKRRNATAAIWGRDPKDAPRGDWLLFAPDSTDPEGN